MRFMATSDYFNFEYDSEPDTPRSNQRRIISRKTRRLCRSVDMLTLFQLWECKSTSGFWIVVVQFLVTSLYHSG